MRITVSAPTTPRAPHVLDDTAVVEYRFFEDILASVVSGVVSVATTSRWSTREVAPACDVIPSPFAFDVAMSSLARGNDVAVFGHIHEGVTSSLRTQAFIHTTSGERTSSSSSRTDASTGVVGVDVSARVGGGRTRRRGDAGRGGRGGGARGVLGVDRGARADSGDAVERCRR